MLKAYALVKACNFSCRN